MANFSFHEGDLLESGCDVIAHQTNCQAKMGAGIAKSIKEKWPRVYGYYLKFCHDKWAEGKSPLGSCQLVFTDATKTQIVANLYGQEHYGRNRRQTDYDALRSALHELSNSKYLRNRQLTIGFPFMMGSALGGGDWDTVMNIILDEFDDYPGRVEIWRL